jgi:cytoskeleton protein RodZ
MMPDVGHLLQEAREQKQINLEDAEQELKIRQKFLVALENDQRNHVLDPIYMRGFLKNYARYLGLDTAEIMRIYDGGVEPVPVLPPATPPSRPALKPPVIAVPPPATEPRSALVDPAPIAPAAVSPVNGLAETAGPVRRTSPLRFVAIGLLAFVLFLGTVGGAVKLVGGVGAMPPAKATAAWAMTAVLQPGKVSAAPQATPTPKPSPTITPTPSVTPTPTITPTPTPIVYTGVDIELIVSDRAWLQVTTDGQKVLEGILEAGQRRSWHGNDRVQVRCGNGGGVEALVNGVSIGKLGDPGQVVDNEWLKESVPAPATTSAAAGGGAITGTTPVTATTSVTESTVVSNTQPAVNTGPVNISVVPVGSQPVTSTAPVSPTAKQ